MRILKFCVSISAVLLLGGCLSYNGYVDPNYEQATLEEIRSVDSPHKIKVNTKFQINGEPQPDSQNEIDLLVNDVFVKSGVVFPFATSDRVIELTINNIADMGGAAAKGFITGLTFGAVGAAVQETYQFDIALSNKAGEEIIQKVYTQVLHTTIGNKGAPVENATPYKDGTKAFQKILENAIFSFIKEMQAINELSLQPIKNIESLSETAA